MKKLVILLLVVASLLSMCACGKSGGESEVSESETESSESVVYTEIEWPKSDIAKLLPVPKSSIGEILWEASYGFVIYISETPKEDYDEYVSQCQDAGFTVDYSKGDDYFWGDNEDGYHVSMRYEGNDVMFIRIDEPDEEDLSEESTPEESSEEESIDISSEEENTDDSSVAEESASEDAAGVTPEFKEMMDSYEAFFDEYVEFMKKYKESADPTSLAEDLSSYLTKYADVMAKIGAIDDSELSVADTAYYVEVSGRIMKKIAEVA